MPRRSWLLVVPVLLAPFVPPAAVSAAPSIVPGNRPHSRVVTYDHGVRVTRLQVVLRRSDHRLRGRILLTAESTTGRAVTRMLRVGRCVGGTLAAPRCPAGASFTVRVPADGSVSLSRAITLRQPAARYDAVEARLVRGGASPAAYFSAGDAELLVRGRAWRGVTAGHGYGVVLGGTRADAAIGRIQVDAPAVRPDELYASVVYTASGDRLGTPDTVALRSPPPTAELGTTLANSRGSGPTEFRDRFGFARRGSATFGVQVRGDAGLLGRVLLPWPVAP